jgi:hypothetical protein
LEQKERSGVFNRGERFLAGAILVSIITVAALAVSALLAEQSVVLSISGSSVATSSITRPPPRITSEKQLMIRTGISAVVTPDGPSFYTWGTSLQSTTRSFVVSIKAVLNLTRGSPPIEQTHFFILSANSFAVVGPNTPLNFNQTATAEPVNLTPPTPGFFQNGQSFPETVTVVLQNGTSYSVQITAPVVAFA